MNRTDGEQLLAGIVEPNTYVREWEAVKSTSMLLLHEATHEEPVNSKMSRKKGNDKPNQTKQTKNQKPTKQKIEKL